MYHLDQQVVRCCTIIGANVKANINGSGSIVEIVGIATTGSSFGISTAKYNHLTGQLQVTTSTNHDLEISMNS